MSIIRKALLFSIFTLLYINTHSQIKIQHLPFSENDIDSSFLSSSKTRVVKVLNKNWQVFSEKDKHTRTNTSIPCIFTGSDNLIFETTFSLTQEEIDNNILKLCFLGIYNYSEISINNFNIYKKSGSEIPFEIELPKDLLESGNTNIITIKVISYLDTESTIPINKRFLFPQNPAGILRDIYLKIIPTIHISETVLELSFENSLSTAIVNASIGIKNLPYLNSINENSFVSDQIKINIQFKPANFTGNTFNFDFNIPDINQPVLQNNYPLQLQNPTLWFPESPNYYDVEVSLFLGSSLLDVVKKEISFLSLKESNNTLLLNNQSFRIQGITYFLNESELSNTTSYQRLREDLSLIKETGFNAVRFAKSYPHPYAIKLCNKYGLIPLIELPINSIPEKLLDDPDFRIRASSKLKEMIIQYSKISNNIIFGLGSSFLASSTSNLDFIKYLLNNIRDNSFSSYASFIGIPPKDIDELTLLGIELYSEDAERFFTRLENSYFENSLHRIFISEVNYPDYNGSSSGYLTKNSTEAQAKHFEKYIDNSIEKKIGGFILSTFNNYGGDFNSLYGGYSQKRIYNLGIIKEDGGVNSLPFRVVNAKLNNLNNITIPIGSGKDENKLIFILIALALSILMAILINTKKKFREDCSRALFRPYNFFADVRDHRIISGVHTIILMLVEIGSMALLITILLYYLRTNFLFDKIILSFGSKYFTDFIGYLAWNPEKSLIYLSIFMILKIAFLTLAIKIGSFFIKTRVNTLSIFYTVVWSFLPFTLFLPVELILFKVLTSAEVNIYVAIILLLFCLWILQRLVKGIYVIFETRGLIIYFYTFSLILVIAGGILLYFQLTDFTIYHIVNSIKQYTSLSL